MSDGIHTELEQLIRLRANAAKLPLFSSQKTQAMQAGTKQSSHLGRGMDFAEVRPYQAGDDVRHINWRLTARAGKPYSKIYQEERERPIYLIIDQSNSMAFGTRSMFKQVLAAQIAALFAWAGLKHNDQIGGAVFTDTAYHWLKPKRQRKTVLQLLNQIVLAQQAYAAAESENNFYNALNHLQREMSSGSIVIIISDFAKLDVDSERLIQSISRYNTVLNILTYDVLETSAPQNNLFHFTDGEHNLEFDGFSQNYLQSYQALFAKRVQQLKQLSQSSRARLLLVATNDDIYKTLKKVSL